MFVWYYRNLILLLLVPELSVFVPHSDHWIHSLVWSAAFTVPTEPLLCKFADGGQKKRQNQGKYLQNGRPWARDGDTVIWTILTRPFLKLTCCVYIFLAANEKKNMFKSFEFCALAACFSTNCTGVCMSSLVLNPVYCFPREEWRLRMTLQPYKMGEWYAGTDWKQSQPSRKVAVLLKLW